MPLPPRCLGARAPGDRWLSLAIDSSYCLARRAARTIELWLWLSELIEPLTLGALLDEWCGWYTPRPPKSEKALGCGGIPSPRSSAPLPLPLPARPPEALRSTRPCDVLLSVPMPEPPLEVLYGPRSRPLATDASASLARSARAGARPPPDEEEEARPDCGAG